MAAPDKMYRAKVTVIDTGAEYSYTMKSDKDWSVFSDALVEIRDVSGLKAYFPVASVIVEIT